VYTTNVHQFYLRTTYSSMLVFTSSPSLHIHQSPLVFQMELEKDGWE